jgi:acyl CoA:acetate/3-ketoacid CoA transferase alpha subunit
VGGVVEVVDKVKTMAEVVKTISDGSHVALSGFAITRAAMAFVHELIRQKKRDLTVSQCIASLDTDLLVGAGCVKKIIYGGGRCDRFGPFYNIDRAKLEKRVVAEEYSGLSICLKYLAGALGIPYIPSKSLLGSDILRKLKEVAPDQVMESKCPFTGEALILLRALQPDVAVIHAQRADREGNAVVYGPLFDTKEKARAAKRVIITADEIVDVEITKRDPERVVIPGYRVDAVVYAPYGAHPTSCYRYYDYDKEHIELYLDYCRKGEVDKYIEEFVLSTENHWEYLKRVGPQKLYEIKAEPYLGY